MTRRGPRICLKVHCVQIWPKKVQKEVSQMANRNFSLAMLLGGLSVNLNHLKITSKEKLPKRYSLGSFSGCLHKKTSETVKNTSKTVKHQQIWPRNLSACCLHGVCTSGICLAEALLAEAEVEKTPHKCRSRNKEP